MADDLSGLSDDEMEALVEDVRARMRPVEQQLAELRAERDVLLTERRRRERSAHRERRANVKEAMRAGSLPTFAELIASAEAAAWDDFRFNLKTGGEVRLGFPGARQQVGFTDGRRLAQARDL